MDPVITALYLRKSRADETDERVGDTLRRHKETLLAFAAERGLTIAEIYEEVVSGDSLYARPQMLRLLENVEKGAYDAVLCMDLDRLGRGGMSDQGIILETFKNSGTRIITPRKTYDLNDELDEEYTEFETFLARRELKLIKRRLQRGIRKTIEDGGYIANAPYGYEKTTLDRHPTLKIKEDEAAFVRLVFDLYLSERCGCQAIADELNRLGAKPRRAAAFGRNAVLRILKNPVYCGKVAWDQHTHVKTGGSGTKVVSNPKSAWTLVPGLHPPLIGEADFDRVQAILQSRSQSSHFDGTLQNPLAGLLFCAKCGRLMQRRPVSGRETADLLICPTRGCCSAARLDLVEQAVLDAVRDLWAPFEPLEAAFDTSPGPDLAPAVAAAERDLATAAGQEARLHDLLEQGIYDPSTYRQRMDVLLERERELEAALRHLRERQASVQSGESPAPGVPGTVSALYAQSGPKERNRLLKASIVRACYRKEKDWGPRRFQLIIEWRPMMPS